ncbi:MAG: hypothetical protein VW226_12885, partial [Rhodospirillaceae bacterium]
MRYSTFGLKIGALTLAISAPAYAQTAGGNGEITGFSPAQMSIVKENIAGSASGGPCGRFIRDKGLKVGINNQGKRSEKTLEIGVAEVSAKPQSEGYVDDRYIAFREAWLDANSKLAIALEAQVRSKAQLQVKTGLNNVTEVSAGARAAAYRQQAANIAPPKEKGQTGLGDAINNGARLLNAYLSDELKKRGHDLEAERKAKNETNAAKKKELLAKAAAAEAEAKRLTASKGFKEVIEAAALERMKGIYTAFTSEIVSPSGDKTRMCVVLQYSPRSERLADMMASRDFSQIPKLEPDQPLLRQLPDPSTPQGVFELNKSWGLNILFDENGDVNVVAYGQAGFRPGSEIEEEAARSDAMNRAMGLIRLFINQTISAQKKSKIGKNVKEYVDQMKEVKITKSSLKNLEQSSDFAAINGMSQILDWSGLHVINNWGIAGSIVAWNATSASG